MKNSAYKLSYQNFDFSISHFNLLDNNNTAKISELTNSKSSVTQIHCEKINWVNLAFYEIETIT